MKNKQKNCSDDYWILEDSKNFGLLLEVKSYYFGKKETISKIKAHLEFEKINDLSWKNIENEKLDVAIVIHVNKKRYDSQDVDNIAKVVLDALKKGNSENYLIKDDCQIIGLLVDERQREESKDSDTDQLSVSIRKHNPKKDMKIIRSYSIMNEEEYKEYLNNQNAK